VARPAEPLRVTHIVLDVDGTLVDWDRAHGAALDATSARVTAVSGVRTSPEMLQAARNAVAAEPAMRGAMLRAIRDESLRRVLAERGVANPAAVADVCALHYATRDANLRPFDEVADALRDLDERGFTLIAASNGNAALERLPIAARFAHLHFAEAVGVSKPDPGFFAAALEITGGTPEQAVSVGDRLENDYLPARELGMHAVLVDRAGAVDDPDVRRIRSLAELVDIVAPAEGTSRSS
jgi:putative hydrolase of the HAD superfamily